MAVDQDALADVVVMTVKAAMASALGPILERIAATEARQAMSGDVQRGLSDLRDRIVTVETKAATPQPEPVSSEPVDLGPILERLAVAETRLNMHLPIAEKVLGELRDRVAVVESKAATEQRLEPAMQSEDHLSPVLERLAVAETRLNMHLPTAEKALGELRDRVTVVETKAATVVPLEAVPAPAVADLGPLQERLAVAEQCNKELAARVHDLSGLRDRVAVVETKASAVVPLEVAPVPQVDLSPVLERVAAAEARLDVLGDLRDRVVVVETKAAVPVNDTTADLRAKVDTVMASLGVIDTIDLRDRLAALEARPAVIPALPEKAADLTPVLERLTKAEMRMELKATETAPILTTLADLTKDVGAMRERVAVLEVRPSVPGPVGEPGPAGKDGVNGKDGAAGLSFEGVYQEGKLYDVGQLATWAGSSWHCNEPTTTKPGDGSKAWTLMVKRGRDGKDGRDAEGALPVVAVGRAG